MGKLLGTIYQLADDLQELDKPVSEEPNSLDFRIAYLLDHADSSLRKNLLKIVAAKKQ